MDTVWSELDDLLQLCYSAADDVYLIHSQYTTSTSLWEIHVLDNSKGGSYHWARLTAGEDMKDQRSPPAESESGFVHWVVESLLAGQTTITARTEKLRIGTAQVYLDVHLNAAEDQDAYHRISWQLLIKLAQHIQKEGCSIGSDHSRLLKEENEYMNAQLNALMSQEAQKNPRHQKDHSLPAIRHLHNVLSYCQNGKG
ncbi:hypothetical protein BX666DRAFT_2032094 [Dichotomocladium elegans]|nr:hypothetical protein BX666DRAFT_2032094 [Dichotomocladium elegans]